MTYRLRAYSDNWSGYRGDYERESSEYILEFWETREDIISRVARLLAVLRANDRTVRWEEDDIEVLESHLTSDDEFFGTVVEDVTATILSEARVIAEAQKTAKEERKREEKLKEQRRLEEINERRERTLYENLKQKFDGGQHSDT